MHRFFYSLKNKNVQKKYTHSIHFTQITYLYNIIQSLIKNETKSRYVRCVLQDVVHRA